MSSPKEDGSNYEFDTYQAWTDETAVYKDVCKTPAERLVYCILGLVEEAGEVAGKVKKRIRKGGFAALEPGTTVTWEKGGELLEETYGQFLGDLEAEFGDTIYYFSQGLLTVGLSAGKVALSNRAKLLSRKARGMLRGSGDNR